MGVQMNLDEDLLQDFKWGQVTVDWVIHKISRRRDLGLKDGDTLGGRDSFVYAFTQLRQTPLAVLGQDEEWDQDPACMDLTFWDRGRQESEQSYYFT